jgi:hypothetical protein
MFASQLARGRVRRLGDGAKLKRMTYWVDEGCGSA